MPIAEPPHGWSRGVPVSGGLSRTSRYNIPSLTHVVRRQDRTDQPDRLLTHLADAKCVCRPEVILAYAAELRRE